MTFDGNSTVSFSNNKAYANGGAIYITNPSIVIFKGYSMTTVADNEAGTYGGAVYVQNGAVICEGNSVVVFHDNTAGQGGALFID